ncbi:hypothetical protein STEG23_029820 [Scotinomys teguina]
MLGSLAHTDTRDCVNIHGPCYHQKPNISLWSVLPLTVSGKEATLAVGIGDGRPTVERERNIGLCDNPYHHSHPIPQKSQPRQKTIIALCTASVTLHCLKPVLLPHPKALFLNNSSLVQIPSFSVESRRPLMHPLPTLFCLSVRHCTYHMMPWPKSLDNGTGKDNSREKKQERDGGLRQKPHQARKAKDSLVEGVLTFPVTLYSKDKDSHAPGYQRSFAILYIVSPPQVPGHSSETLTQSSLLVLLFPATPEDVGVMEALQSQLEAVFSITIWISTEERSLDTNLGERSLGSSSIPDKNLHSGNSALMSCAIFQACLQEVQKPPANGHPVTMKKIPHPN